MKRYIFTFVLLITICFGAFAQNNNGVWTTTIKEKDTILNRPQRVYYSYCEICLLNVDNEKPSLTLTISSDGFMVLQSPHNRTFVRDVYIKNDKRYVDLSVEIYDVKNQLISSNKITCRCDRNFNMLFITDKDIKKDIIKALNGDGYVKLSTNDFKLYINNIGIPYGKRIKKEAIYTKSEHLLMQFGVKGKLNI